jgi:TolB protein
MEALAVSGSWVIQPRPALALPLDSPLYRDVVGEILKSEGIANPVIVLTEVLEADLEGDGAKELLISASYSSQGVGSRPARSGDYSLVLLQKMVGNSMKTTLLLQDIHPAGSESGSLASYRIFGVYDLNGDGSMEVVVDGTRGGDYGALAFELTGDSAEHVLSLGCLQPSMMDFSAIDQKILFTSKQGDILIFERTRANPWVENPDVDSEIHLMNIDGSGEVNLTQHPANDWEHRWAPSGDSISFLSDRGTGEDIYVMRPDGSDPVNITRTGTEKSGHEWSPTGSRIAFVDLGEENEEIYVVDSQGKGLLNLSKNPAVDEQFAWSPDGSKLAFVSDRDGDEEIYLINVDGTGLLQLTHNSALDSNPVWSPDGDLLVFTSNVSPHDEDRGASQGYGLDLYTIRPDGSDPTLLTSAPQLYKSYNPRWSPDGKKIVFSSVLRDCCGHLPWYPFLINRDGSGLTPIQHVESFGIMDFLWSPDASHIAIYYGNSDSYPAGETIMVVTAEGKDPVMIDSNNRFNSMPVWTEDSSYLVYSSGSGEVDPRYDPSPLTYGVNIIRRDGVCFTRLTTEGATFHQPILSP